mgnify:CR=1 FL=1
MIKLFIRVFIKITGFLPFYLIVKPRFYYSTYKAKKESRDLKDGAIVVSNHTHIFDYYVFIFRYITHIIHTMVADIVYKNIGLPTLNKIMGNIKIDSKDPSNFVALQKSRELLQKNKTLLIFPEGRLEDKKGELIDFKPSAALLAWETNKPIIPYYVNGKYGLFSRVHLIAGEKIYLRKIFPEGTDVNVMVNYVKNEILRLKHQLEMMEKHNTHDIVHPRFFIMDLAKVLAVPWPLLFWSKTTYLADKKEIKRLLKDNALIASNHIGLFDPINLVLSFFSRRLRIIAQEELWDRKFLPFAMEHAGVIKYRRVSMNKFDMKFVLEVKEILEARGVVGIYPQGHIMNDKDFNKPLMGGLAMISLITKTPIIPFLMDSEYRIFHKTNFAIGEPIYPERFLNGRTNISNQLVNEYNDYIYNHMKQIYDTIRQVGNYHD